jgi:membrane-associated phospholipid phosphatase
VLPARFASCSVARRTQSASTATAAAPEVKTRRGAASVKNLRTSEIGTRSSRRRGAVMPGLPRAPAPAPPAARWQIWSLASFAGTRQRAICCCCSGKARPRDGTLSRSEAALSPHFLNFLADLGDIALIGPAIAAACATLLLCGRHRDAVAWALAFAACTAATLILKTLVGGFAISILGCRIETGAFPSGHAAIGVVFYGGLAMLLWRGSRSALPRAMAVALVLVQAMIVGSVFLLRWHPLVDLAAGLLLGAACLGLAYWRALPAPAKLGELAGLALVVASVVAVLHGERFDDKKFVDRLLNRVPVDRSAVIASRSTVGQR